MEGAQPAKDPAEDLPVAVNGGQRAAGHRRLNVAVLEEPQYPRTKASNNRESKNSKVNDNTNYLMEHKKHNLNS